jgi:hypothetical protein
MRSKNISSEYHKVRGHLRDVNVTGTITLKIWCEGAVWTQLRTVLKYDVRVLSGHSCGQCPNMV